jgi:hypothetical protein
MTVDTNTMVSFDQVRQLSQRQLIVLDCSTELTNVLKMSAKFHVHVSELGTVDK